MVCACTFANSMLCHHGLAIYQQLIECIVFQTGLPIASETHIKFVVVNTNEDNKEAIDEQLPRVDINAISNPCQPKKQEGYLSE